MISIHYLEEIDKNMFKDAVFITGFQGFGMVGYLTTRHIAYELRLRRIGFIKTRYLPEITFYNEKHGISYPFELYYGKRNNVKLVVLVNHAIPLERERTIFAEFIAKWVKEHGISRVILVGGLDPALRESKEEKYRWIPISNYKIDLKSPILSDKFVIGPLALTIMFMNAYKVPGVAIFSYAELYRPDPRASVIAVEVIANLIGLSIDVKRLIEEASIIEALEEERKKIFKIVEGEVKSEKPRYTMHV